MRFRVPAIFILLIVAVSAQCQAPRQPAIAGSPAPYALPRASYPGVPGWLVIDGLHAQSADDMAAPRDAGYTISIFPFDSAWTRVDARSSLTLILPNGATRVVPQGRAWRKDSWDATVLSVRASDGAATSAVAAAWLLPALSVPDAAVLPVRDSLSPNGDWRSWTAGPVWFVLRRTDSISAVLTAERDGWASHVVRRVAIDSALDRAMGADPQTKLSLQSDWRLPLVIAAYRFGRSGAIAAVLTESGYECQNYFVVVFLASGIEVIDEPHYFFCPS
jgi:hypothetical protein